MPRTVEEILAHADELAGRFEDYHPNPADELSLDAALALRGAVGRRADAEKDLLDAVRRARASGLTWSAIGTLVGTTGEAARQRYGKLVA